MIDPGDGIKRKGAPEVDAPKGADSQLIGAVGGADTTKGRAGNTPDSNWVAREARLISIS